MPKKIKKVNVLLLRHAPREMGKGHGPEALLTLAGKRKAFKKGGQLPPAFKTRFISSDYPRTQQTASGLARGIRKKGGAVYTNLSGFKELSQMPFTQKLTENPNYMEIFHKWMLGKPVPKGLFTESPAETAKRVAKVLRFPWKLHERGAEKMPRFAVVGHNFLLDALFYSLTKKDPFSLPPTGGIKELETISLVFAGNKSTVTYRGKKFYIKPGWIRFFNQLARESKPEAGRGKLKI